MESWNDVLTKKRKKKEDRIKITNHERSVKKIEIERMEIGVTKNGERFLGKQRVKGCNTYRPALVCAGSVAEAQPSGLQYVGTRRQCKKGGNRRREGGREVGM